MTFHDDDRTAECEVCGAVYSGARAIRSYTRIVWTDEGLDTEEGFTICREDDCADTMRERIAEGTR